MPQIERVVLEQFSLFENVPRIDVAVNEGVFCLAGANGLGKSTFLAAVNYGLTGRVPEPARSFRSAAEYYRDSRAYTRSYFAGRINERDRQGAQVTLSFSVGDTSFELTRGMFEVDELRSLTVLNGSTVVSGDGAMGRDELHETYATLVADATGLGDFRQFVFLQLFLLTFDERRELLFWNDLVAEQVLYLAFGVDASVAPRAEDLRRQDEGFESQARNQQYAATQASQRLKKLGEALGDSPVDPDLRRHYDELLRERDSVRAAAEHHRASVEDAKLQLAGAVAERARSLDDYEQGFARAVAPIRDPERHPLVATSRSEERCQLCGQYGPHVRLALETAQVDGVCPLCRHALEHDGTTETDELARLNSLVIEARAEVALAQRKLDRVTAEFQIEQHRLATLDSSLAQLEEQAGPALFTPDPDLEERVRQLEVERVQATERRDEYRRQRDVVREELRRLRATLGEQYTTAEIDFVPMFTELASDFLGLNIDIQMKSKAESLGFMLAVEGEPRRVTEALSESQRFFVDIALRMALAKFMSADGAPATMFVDTPEGSLDIAYEAQAGDMFAKFVMDGFNILMTANINTSQLLLELASRCRSARMKLHRMTDWAPLSAVQIRSEDLFDKAFAGVERALAEGLPSDGGS